MITSEILKTEQRSALEVMLRMVGEVDRRGVGARRSKFEGEWRRGVLNIPLRCVYQSLPRLANTLIHTHKQKPSSLLLMLIEEVLRCTVI